MHYATTTAFLWPLYRSSCISWQSPVKNWLILLEQSFTACVPLLTATSALVLGRRCSSFNHVNYAVSVPSNSCYCCYCYTCLFPLFAVPLSPSSLLEQNGGNWEVEGRWRLANPGLPGKLPLKRK